MDGLQEAFYIMAIIFMGLTFIMIIALVTSVFVIRSKINKIHDNIEDKLNKVTSIAEKSGALSAKAGYKALKQAQKVIKKTKK